MHCLSKIFLHPPAHHSALLFFVDSAIQVSSAFVALHATANTCRANDKRTIIVRQRDNAVSPELHLPGNGRDPPSEKEK
jgi:hypothetical protein